MIAHVAAAPALERLEGQRGPLVVSGRARGAAYVDLDGFVVVLTGPDVPLLPNAIALTGPPPPGGTIDVALAGATTWVPTLSLGPDASTRGREILTTLDQPSERHQTPLSGAVGRREIAAARAVGEALVGRGAGSTPEGDDLVAGAAAVVAAGPWDAGEKAAWLDALIPADLRRRTTALSATLLELAATGRIAEPVHGLFGPHWRSALDRLLRLGHSTGRAYALGAATAATRLRGP